MDVIISHINADFDCLGAMTAALRLYPGALLCFAGSQERRVRDFMERHPAYLPPYTRFKELDLTAITRLIIVDCQQASRIGAFAGLLGHAHLDTHIYDHHPVSEETLRCTGGEIAPRGSASTLLATRLMARDIELTAEEATVIMIGIHEDTGGLLYESSTPEDYRVAAWLLAQGARLSVVSDALTPELTTAQITLLKQLLSTLKSASVNGRTVSIAHASSDNYVGDIASLAHLMRDMESSDALFVVVAMEEHVYLVARSNCREIDVGVLMKEFQGGGHATAASAVAHHQKLGQVLERLDHLLHLSVTGGDSAGSIMTTPVKTMAHTLTIAEARELLTRYNCNAMPVMTGNVMAGVISRKIVEKALYHGLGAAPVTDFMHSEYFSATVETPLLTIQSYMVNANRRFVPVFEGSRLLGAVTRTDLMRHFHGGRRGRQEELYDLESLKVPTRTHSIAGLLGKRLSRETIELLHKLGDTGGGLGLSVYAVGGFVRDLLLGISNCDIDITVEGDGVLFAECFADRFGGRVRSHKKFGTAVLVLPDGAKIDIASTRLEYYESPGALPTVERASLRHDLHRRDFTINTLALCLNRDRFGQLTDHFGGLQDIQERVVRVLHNLSFVEDPTRVFRAIRFEQRLGFHIAPHTENLIRSAVRMHLLDKLGGERLFSELHQIMCEKEPVGAITRMSVLGLLPFIHPSLKLTPPTERVVKETGQVMAWFRLLYLKDRCETWQVYFLALCDGLTGAEFQEACSRLALPGRLQTRFCSQRQGAFSILHAVKRRLKQEREVRNSELYLWFSGFTIELLLSMAARASSEQIRRLISHYLNRVRDITPLLGGDDLCRLGVTPGPIFKRLKERLFRERLDGMVKSREDEEQLIQQLIGQEDQK